MNLSLSGMEEHFILIQMVLPEMKEMDKIKNVEEPEMEEEEPEEVEERVFNHLQQQHSQRKQFQPSDVC